MKKKKIQNKLTTTCVPQIVSLAVVFHMLWYKAATFSLTQVFAVEVIIYKMQRKGTSPEGKPTINE